MGSPYGKKFVVISEEEYERLKKRQKIISNPTKREFIESEKQMKDVLNESEIPNDEKIRLFTENLNHMKKQYDELNKPKQVRVVTNHQKNPEEAIAKREEEAESLENRSSLEKSIIKSLPKSNQVTGELILNHLKNFPKIIKWNEFGELIYKDETIRESNLTDLISNVLLQKKSTTPPLLHETIFLKALSETNAPETWIKNKSKKKILQSYKNLKAENPFLSPIQNKKPKINWSTST